jgi:hypothetical protein
MIYWMLMEYLRLASTYQAGYTSLRPLGECRRDCFSVLFIAVWWGVLEIDFSTVF